MARTVDHRRREERRAAIVQAAAPLFARQGFAGTTTAGIAATAGISTGSLFYYFHDKNAIFRAIFEDDIAATRDLFERLADIEAPLTSLLTIVGELAAPARDELAPGLMVELIRRAGEDAALMEAVAATEALVQDGVADLIERAGERGLVDRELDPHEAARWIRTIVDGVYLNAASVPDVDPVPMLRRIVVRFLGADPAAVEEAQRP